MTQTLLNISCSGGLQYLIYAGYLIVLFLAYKGWKSYKSGSESLPSTNNPTGTDYGKAPSSPQYVWYWAFGALLLACTIWANFSIVADYKNVIC